MDTTLPTARLTLRPLTPDDAAPSARIMSPAIARWTGSWTGVETAEEIEGRIVRSLEAERAGQRLMRAVALTGTGELIGWVGVMRLAAEPERGSLGYWLGEAWFGQGYGKEAARAAVEAAWAALDLQVIEAVAQVPNTASHRILLGLGMTHMGQRMEFARARGVADLCAWYELRRTDAAGPRSGT
jgi:[ribosomal protein S5]-alanine N-acetyltransferase